MSNLTRVCFHVSLTVLIVVQVSCPIYAGQSANYTVAPDVLDSSGGAIESGSLSIFYSCGEHATMGYSSSGMFQLRAGFVPKYYHVLSGGIIGDREALLQRVMLSPGRPNPFTTSTVISYTAPSFGRVSLSVYDISGRKVCTIEEGLVESGVHKVSWDGRNEYGEELSPGLYVAVLDTCGERKTQKIVLVR